MLNPNEAKRAAAVVAYLRLREKMRRPRPLSAGLSVALAGGSGSIAVALITRLFRVLCEAEVKQHRFLLCPRYNKCLDFAEEAGWRSFSCFKCPRFLAIRSFQGLVQ